MKKMLYYLFLLAILSLGMIERLNHFSVKNIMMIGVAIICGAMLFTRIPFLNHELSSIKSMERLVDEQQVNPFMSWNIFFLIVIPLLAYIILV